MSKHNSSILDSDSTKVFLYKLLVIVLSSILYILYITPQYRNSYSGELAEKIARLKAIEDPKIVLIGNSNVAFGFDSEYIEREMGMPVVNMGFHGGVGNKFHDDMMDYNVTPGDIYVVCHHSYYCSDKIENPVLAWTAIENNKDLLHLIKREDIPQMIDSFPSYIKKCTHRYNTFENNKNPDIVYSKEAFNEYGDICVERDYTGEDFSEDIWLPVVDESEINRLNKWNEYMNERGASLVVSISPIIYDQWPADDKEMDVFQNDLEDALDCDVISYWKDYSYDSEMFYNTPNHLNTKGAKLRSIQLVKDLKKWQKENG